MTNLEAEGKFVRIVATRVSGEFPGPLFGQIEIGLKGWDKLILYPDVTNYFTDNTENMAYQNGVFTVYTNSTFFGEWTMTYMLCDDGAWTSASPLPEDYDIFTYASEADSSYCTDSFDLTYVITDVYRTEPIDVHWATHKQPLFQVDAADF